MKEACETQRITPDIFTASDLACKKKLGHNPHVEDGLPSKAEMQEIRDSYKVLPLREKRRLQKAATKRSRGGARIDLDTPSAAHWKLQGQTAPLGH